MNIAIFVWTFSGVVQAIALGIAIILFAAVILLVALVRLLDWWHAKKRRG